MALRSGTAKSRFSPLSPTPAHHGLTHPRTASLHTIAEQRTSGLFASIAVNGQGACSSQVTETQFFGQSIASVGVDVSNFPPKDSPVSCASSPFKNTSTPAAQKTSTSPPVWTPPVYLDAAPEDDDVFTENSWSDDDMRAFVYRPYCADSDPHRLDDGFPMDPPALPAQVQVKVASPAQVQVKVEHTTPPLVPSAPSGELAHQPDNVPTLPFELTPLEQWVILRLREAKRDGISAVDALRQAHRRYLKYKRREAELLSQLQQIHALSRPL
ncbi:hypothetical protein C8R46DRAFT_1045716 [Mycena filopes]|nr:hypothetical protein C8R46DRAFT_1045716 [Mycena filopes]